jgi:hypothetical protein
MTRPKSKCRFSIPENVLQEIPAEKLYLRKRSGRAGLNIVTAPHIIISTSYYVYGDQDFVIPHPKVGLSADLESADYLRAISILLNSSIIKYYLFFQSSSWGIDRSLISPKDVKRIPIPEISVEQIFELASLQRELQILESNNSLSSSLLQDRLDQSIESILKLPEDLTIMARDFALLKLQLNKGKVIVSATEQPHESDLRAYGLCLRDELDDFTAGSGLRHKLILTYSKKLIVCSVEFVFSKNTIDVSVEKAQGESSSFFSYIQEKVKQRFSQWVYVQRDLRIFEKSRVYICKSPRLIDWTRTQALNDSDDIIAQKC